MTTTPSQTIGPFFNFGTSWLCDGGAGPLLIGGTVYDGAGDPVPDALLEFWQVDRFTRCLTDADGRYSFRTDAAPHIDVSVFARGLLQRLVTRIYFEIDGSDPVLEQVPAERRGTLLAVPTEGGLQFDIHLQGDEETVFFAW